MPCVDFFWNAWMTQISLGELHHVNDAKGVAPEWQRYLEDARSNEFLQSRLSQETGRVLRTSAIR
jgi:hypothetical protein